MECYNEGFFKRYNYKPLFQKSKVFEIVVCGINYQYVEGILTIDTRNKLLRRGIRRAKSEFKRRGTDIHGENHSKADFLYFIVNWEDGIIKIMYEGDK